MLEKVTNQSAFEFFYLPKCITAYFFEPFAFDKHIFVFKNNITICVSRFALKIIKKKLIYLFQIFCHVLIWINISTRTSKKYHRQSAFPFIYLYVFIKLVTYFSHSSLHFVEQIQIQKHPQF